MDSSNEVRQIKELPAFHLYDIAAMVNYTEIYEDGKLLVTIEGNKYELQDFYCKNPDCDCTNTRFGVKQYGEEIGEIWYDYKKKKIIESSDFDHLIKELRASDEGLNEVFDLTLSQRHELIKNTFKILQLKTESKQLKQKVVDLETQIKRLNKPNKKIGRNEPCPCGSGKKYKKCCL